MKEVEGAVSGRQWKPPDGGYGWVVVGSALGLQCLHNYSFCTFGVFLLHWIEYFDTSAAQMGWVASIRMFAMILAGLLAPGVIDRHGSQRVAIFCAIVCSLFLLLLAVWSSLVMVFVAYGFVQGLFGTTMYSSALSCVQQYFTTKRSQAAAIALLGMSLAMFMFPPLVQYLVDQYGWRGAVLISSALYLHGVPIAWVLKHTPLTRQKAADMKAQGKYIGCSGVVDMSAFTSTPASAVYVASLLLLYFGHIIPPSYLPVHGVLTGYTEQASAYFVSIIGLSGFVFRPLQGWLADRSCVNRTLMYTIVSLCSGACVLCFTLVHQYYQIVVLTVGFSCFSSGYMSVIMPIFVDILGVSNIAKGVGMSFMCYGVGGLASQAVAGILLDSTGYTNLNFVTAGSSQVMAGVMAFVAYWLQKRRAVLHSKENDIQLTDSKCNTTKQTDSVCDIS